MNIAKTLAGKVTFITGAGKNTGKTTFLNYALGALRARAGVGFMSVGVDGESSDSVYGSLKPRVLARRGNLVVTSESALEASGGGFSILRVFPAATVFGRPLLLKAGRDSFIEITSPGGNAQVSDIISRISGKPCDTLLIDGAVNRLTQVSAGKNANFIYAVKAEPNNLASTADNMNLIAALSSVPLWRGGEKGAHFIKGPLAPSGLQAALHADGCIVIEDFTRVFLDYFQWKQLAAKRRAAFLNRFRLLFFAVGLCNVSRREFEARLDARAKARVIYNPYGATV